jgi:putative ABC transport system ATP-binding protein
LSQKNEYAVETNDLTKVYRTGSIRFTALRDVSLRVRRGEMVSIVGPSGSGKTTLLNLIGLLDKPTRGSIFLDGTEVSKMDEDRKSIIRNKKIGFVFQAYNLIHRLTAIENVQLPLIASGMNSVKRRKLAEKMLSSVGLESKFYNRPYELSAGEQQRVAICRALVADPTLILGDEITGNVDTKTSAQIMGLLKEINKTAGRTFVLITHNPELAREAHRIVYIRDGVIEKEEVLN